MTPDPCILLITEAVQHGSVVWCPCVCGCSGGGWILLHRGWLVAFGLGWKVGEC